MGDIGKRKKRIIQVPATPIRRPEKKPTPAPTPAPQPAREPAANSRTDAMALVLGTKGLDHYRQLSDRTATDTLDHPFIAALIRCRYEARGVPAKDVLSDMNSKLSALLPPPAGWPKGAQSASGQLTRHAPAMRAAGWTVDSDGGHNHEHTSLWTITPPPKVEEEGGRC